MFHQFVTGSHASIGHLIIIIIIEQLIRHKQRNITFSNRTRQPVSLFQPDWIVARILWVIALVSFVEEDRPSLGQNHIRLYINRILIIALVILILYSDVT